MSEFGVSAETWRYNCKIACRLLLDLQGMNSVIENCIKRIVERVTSPGYNNRQTNPDVILEYMYDKHMDSLLQECVSCLVLFGWVAITQVPSTHQPGKTSQPEMVPIIVPNESYSIVSIHDWDDFFPKTKPEALYPSQIWHIKYETESIQKRFEKHGKAMLYIAREPFNRLHRFAGAPRHNYASLVSDTQIKIQLESVAVRVAQANAVRTAIMTNTESTQRPHESAFGSIDVRGGLIERREGTARCEMDTYQEWYNETREAVMSDMEKIRIHQLQSQLEVREKLPPTIGVTELNRYYNSGRGIEEGGEQPASMRVYGLGPDRTCNFAPAVIESRTGPAYAEAAKRSIATYFGVPPNMVGISDNHQPTDKAITAIEQTFDNVTTTYRLHLNSISTHIIAVLNLKSYKALQLKPEIKLPCLPILMQYGSSHVRRTAISHLSGVEHEKAYSSSSSSSDDDDDGTNGKRRSAKRRSAHGGHSSSKRRRRRDRVSDH